MYLINDWQHYLVYICKGHQFHASKNDKVTHVYNMKAMMIKEMGCFYTPMFSEPGEQIANMDLEYGNVMQIDNWSQNLQKSLNHDIIILLCPPKLKYVVGHH